MRPHAGACKSYTRPPDQCYRSRRGSPLGRPKSKPEPLMSFAETALLGALAGFTIYLGLPIGRLELVSSKTRVALAMFSVGVLVFLLVDVLGHGFEIAEDAVTEFKAGDASFGHAAGLALLLVGGFGLGSAGLGILERRLRTAAPLPPIA